MQPPETFAELIAIFIRIIRLILPVLSSLAFLVFGWGIVKFIANADNETKRAEGKSTMLWGLIALFILLSFMGILGFFYSDIGFGAIRFPFLPGGVEEGIPSSVLDSSI